MTTCGKLNVFSKAEKKKEKTLMRFEEVKKFESKKGYGSSEEEVIRNYLSLLDLTNMFVFSSKIY